MKFHDGADFTAEDVKATYDRIVRPPKGVVIPRTPLFATVGEIVVVDPHKIEFRLTEARPKAFMLGAFASGWNIIVRKKTLDDNQGNLRQVMNYPGTGPFRHVSRQGQGSLDPGAEPQLLEQGPALRRQARDLPPAAVLAGAGRRRSCPARSTTRGCSIPVSWRKAKEMPGVTAGVFNQSRHPGVLDEHEEEQGARPIRGCGGPSISPWTGTRWSRW